MHCIIHQEELCASVDIPRAKSISKRKWKLSNDYEAEISDLSTMQQVRWLSVKKFFFRNFSKYICWLMDFPENEKLICLIFKTLNCSKTNIFQRSYWTLTFRELWKFEPNICNYFIYFCQFLSLRIKLFENQIYFSQYCSNLTQEHIKNALIVANTKLTFDLSQIVREMNHQIS